MAPTESPPEPNASVNASDDGTPSSIEELKLVVESLRIWGKGFFAIAAMCGAVLLYFLYTRLDAELKEQQIARQSTPVIVVMPTTETEPYAGSTRRCSVSVTIENGGYLPFTIGSVGLRVYEAIPEDDVLELVSAIETGEDVPEGALYPASSHDMQWKELPLLATRRSIDYPLSPGEKRALRFRFLLTPQRTAKWYRFVVVVSPNEGDESWPVHTVDSVVTIPPRQPQVEGDRAFVEYPEFTRGRDVAPPFPTRIRGN